MGIDISQLRQVPVDQQELEIVERKGLGHPDHICDAVMNEVSVALSKEYIKSYGTVLHHNIDKALLAAGEVRRKFTGGEVVRPMLLVFGDRATFDVDGKPIPVEEIAVDTAKKWFKKNLRFVDRFIENEDQYFKRKAEITEEVTRFVKSRTKAKSVDISVNTLDKRGRGMGGMYLTVLGTSADDGDGGQVGRGNRVNGLIPLNRPTCSEAAAGKNPVSHVGKIYNLLSYEIAEHIYQKVSGLQEVYVWLVSQIGRPINTPKGVGIELVLEKGVDVKTVSKPINDIVKAELNNIDDFSKRLTQGKMAIC